MTRRSYPFSLLAVGQSVLWPFMVEGLDRANSYQRIMTCVCRIARKRGMKFKTQVGATLIKVTRIA